MAVRPNRVRVFEADEIAREITTTFKDRDVEYVREFSFSWPDIVQEIGESVGVAYDSDKWKPKDAKGKRESEIYKHIAESRNRIYAEPGLLRLEDERGKALRIPGPKLSLVEASARGDIVMPTSFSELGRFMECNVILHLGGTNENPKRDTVGDNGVVSLAVRHGMLGASKMKRKTAEGRMELQPFLFVYHPEDGVYFLITGDDLDIEKDGIVG